MLHLRTQAAEGSPAGAETRGGSAAPIERKEQNCKEKRQKVSTHNTTPLVSPRLFLQLLCFPSLRAAGLHVQRFLSPLPAHLLSAPTPVPPPLSGSQRACVRMHIPSRRVPSRMSAAQFPPRRDVNVSSPLSFTGALSSPGVGLGGREGRGAAAALQHVKRCWWIP